MSLIPSKEQADGHERVPTKEEPPNLIGVGTVATEGFEPLLSAEEAAELLRIHPKTLQALARAGTVPCLRMGKYWRFRKSSLDAWVVEQLQLTHQSRRVN